MFIYTKNEQVEKALEAEKCQRVGMRNDGFKVYALSPTSKFNFANQKDTYMSKKIIL